MTWITEIIPGSPAVWLAGLLWTVIVAVGVAWTTASLTGGKNAVTDTVQVSGPLRLPDLPEPTPPTQVTEYDTSDTQTQCIEVPTWLATPHDSTTRSVGISEEETTRLRDFQRPRMAITPLLQGSPPVSVGVDEITFSGYVRGQGRTWTYSIPQETWGIGLQGDVTAGPWLSATSTLGVTRKADRGWFDIKGRIGAGYGALVTDEYRAGPVVKTTLFIGYDW